MTDYVKCCTQCRLPEWYLGNGKRLRFNEGICEICSQEKNMCHSISLDENVSVLEQYLGQIKNQYEYDGIILYTGGKDSTYTLKLMKEKYDLHILAVTWDNGFFSDRQKDNMALVVKKLGIDHCYIQTDWEVLKAIYRNRLFQFGRFCNCVPLVFLFLAPLILEKKAPAVFFSTSAAQTVNAVVKMYGTDLPKKQFDEKVLERGISPVSGFAEEMFDILCVDLLTGEYEKNILSQLKPYFEALIQLRNTRDVVGITPSCFFEWDEREIKKNLDELGWEAMVQRGAYNHSSCLAEEIKAYLSYKQNQINLDVLELAHHKRNNKIAKKGFDELLINSGYCKKKPYYWQQFLDRLDLTETAIEGILQSDRAISLQAKVNRRTAHFLGIDDLDQLQEKMNAIIENRILI